MSKEVEERVAELRFDNKNFEKNIATSLNSLDKLDKKMKFSGSEKGFEKIQKASSKISFDKVSKSVEAVKAKFSTLQVVGMTAISRITNSLIDTGERMASLIPSLITEGGKARALNIEQAKFQFKGLGMSVKKSMASANDAVKGTAYGLDSAAKVASQLGASGMKAGKDMTKSLRAVAGVAAMTGSTFDEIGNIFTTVSGNGRLMSEQLMQMSSRGLNAAAALAKYFNSSTDRMNEFYELYTSTAKKNDAAVTKGAKATEANIRTMVTNGAINFKIFSDAMDYAFGSHAKDADKTFSGAMSNVKAALSRIGAEFASPAYENLRKVFNALIPVIDKVHVALTPLINDTSKIMKRVQKFSVKSLNKINKGLTDKFVNSKGWKELKNAGLVSKTFEKALIRTAKKHDINVNSMIKKEGSFQKTLKKGWLSTDILEEALTKYDSKTSKVTKRMTVSLKKYQKVANDVIYGKYGNGEDRVKALTKAGYDYATAQNIVNHRLLGTKLQLDKLSKTQLKHIGFSKKEIKELKRLERQSKKTGTPLNKLIEDLNKPTAFQLFIDTLRNIPKAAKAVGKSVKNAYRSIFPVKESDTLYKIVDGIHNFSEKLIVGGKTADKVKRSFAGLFAAIDIVRTIVTGGLRFAFKILTNVLGIANIDILSITATIGDAIVAFRKWLYEDSILGKSINLLATHISNAIKKVVEWINELKKIPELQKGFNKFKHTVQSITDGIGKSFVTCTKWISNFFNKIRNHNNEIKTYNKTIANTDKMTSKIVKKNGISFLNIGKNFLNFLNNIKTYLGKGKDLVSDFLDFCNEKLGINLGKVLEVGAVVGAALSIKKVADSFSSLFSIGDSIKGVLGSAKDTLTEYQKSLKADRLVKIAAAIAMLAGAIVVMSLMDQEKVKNSAIVLGVLAGGILMLVRTIDKVSAGKETKLAGTMVGLSASLLMMVGALKVLESVKMDGIEQRILILGTVLLSLTASIMAISARGDRTIKGAATIMSIAIAVRIMVTALKKINNVKVSKSGFKNLAYIMVTLSTITLAASRLKKGTSLGILSIAIALRMMIKTVNMIADLDSKKIGKSIGNFIVLFGSVALIFVAAGNAGDNAAKAGVAVLSVAIALRMMVNVIESLAKMNNNEITKGIGSIAALILLFNSIIAVTKFAGENAKTVATTLISMAVAIGILAGLIKIIGQFRVSEMAKGIACITILTGLLGGIVALTHFAEDCTSTLIAIAGCVGILAGIVYLLTTIPVEKMGSAVIGLGSITGVVAIMSILSKNMSISKKAIVTLASITIVVGALAKIIFLVKDLQPKTVLSIATSLSELLITMTIMTTILSNLSGGAKGAVKGIEALAIVLGGVVGIIAIAGGLEQIPGFSWLMDEGIKVLDKIGYAIGSFVGNIVGGFGAGVSSGLPEIASNLSQFITNLSPFIKSSKNIDNSVMTGIKTLSGAVLSLTAQNFIEGIGKFLGMDMSFDDFGEKIASFGPALMKFQESTKDLDTKVIEKSAKATKYLVDIANELPNTEGFLGWVKGQDDLGSFGDKLKPFGEGLCKFVESTSAIKDFSIVKKSVKVTKYLIDIANELPNTEDFLGWARGQDDLGSFGDKLKPFGEGLSSFIETISAIKDFSIVNKAKKPMQTLVDIANELPNTEGFWGWVEGKDDIGSFGDKISAFGNGLSSFIDSVSGISDFSIVENAKSAVLTLIKLTNDINSEEDLLPKMRTLAIFIAYVNKTVVPELNSFNSNTSNIDSERVVNLSTFVSQLIDSAQKAINVKIDGLKSFVAELPSIGQNIGKYYETIKDVKVLKLIGLTSALTSLSNTSKSLSGSDTEGLKAFVKSFDGIGTESVKSFTKAMIKSSANVQAAISTLFNKVKAKAENAKGDLYNKMYVVGAYTVDGFANGVKANDFKAEAATRVMATKAKKAAQKALDEHSPSKVFEQIGAFTVLGYVRGVDKNREKAINATSGTFKQVIKAASKEMIAGSSIMKRLTNDFFGSFKTNLNSSEIKELYKTSSKAVSDYTLHLYKESEQYKTDTKTVKQHKTELKKLYAERAKLRGKKTVSDKQSEKAAKAATSAEKKANKLKDKEDKKALKLAKKNATAASKKAKSTKQESEKVKKSLKENAKDIKAKKKELLQDQNDVMTHIKSSLSEIKTSLADSVKDFTDPFKEGIDTGISLFEKFEKGTRISTSRILKNMKSQTDGYSKWRDDIASLKKKGLSDGLIEMLKEEGASSGSVRAFLKMTEQEIAEANSYYAKSQKLAGETFMDNFETNMTKASQWSQKLKKLAENGLSQDALEALGALGVEESSQYIDALLSMSSAQIKQFNNNYKKYLKLDDTIANQVIASYAYAGSEGLKALKSKLSKKNAYKIGKNVCAGLTSGISKNSGVVINSATELGTKVIDVINKTLKIHSPSKEMEKSGRFIDEGLASGISKGSRIVQNESVNLADNMVTTMGKALQEISNLVDGGIDTEPTIRPVLDLSNVTDGASRISTMLSGNYVTGINTDVQNNVRSGTNAGGGGTNYAYTQIINSPKAVSRIDIYRDTNQLLKRKATV